MRSPLGDAVYAASESSTERNRLIWGASRPFQMHLIDKTYQEAMVFHKKLSLGFMCCQPKSLEIWIPPGNILGRVVESPGITAPQFFIEDGANNSPIFCIDGPSNSGICCFCLPKETYFKVRFLLSDLRYEIFLIKSIIQDPFWRRFKSVY